MDQLAGKSTELQRFFKPSALFVPGVSWHATRVFLGYNLERSYVFSVKFDDSAKIKIFL